MRGIGRRWMGWGESLSCVVSHVVNVCHVVLVCHVVVIIAVVVFRHDGMHIIHLPFTKLSYQMVVDQMQWVCMQAPHGAQYHTTCTPVCVWRYIYVCWYIYAWLCSALQTLCRHIVKTSMWMVKRVYTTAIHQNTYHGAMRETSFCDGH